MRRAALGVTTLLVLATAIFACQDDATSNGPSLSFDAGGPTPFDGSTPSFDGSIPDGGVPDAPADAPSTPPHVTVTVIGTSGPEADVRIVFHDTTGAVLETKVTGADGKATSTGALPAMASALLANGSSRNIVTWTGLENGDDLSVSDIDNGDPVGQFNVTLPSVFDSASNYLINAGGCSNFTQETSAPVTLYRNCVGAQSSVLATALDNSGAPLAHSFKKANVVPTDGGVADVTTGAWQAPTTVMVSATGLGGNVTATAELLDIADGYGYTAGSQQQVFAGESTSLLAATGFADAYQVDLVLRQTFSTQQVLAKRFAPATSVTFDATQALPAITASSISGTSARRPVLNWTSTATDGSDGGVVRVRYFGPEDANYQWTFIVPPGSMSVTAPAMPPEAESFLPADDDAGPTSFFQPEVVFVEADVLPSYTLFKKLQGSIVSLSTSLAGFSFPAVPMNGNYRASVFSNTD